MAKKPRPATPRVIVTRRLPPNVEARMAELFDTVLNIGDVPMDRAALTRAMAQCGVLVTSGTAHLEPALIQDDRTSDGEGERVSVRVGTRGCRVQKQKKTE